MRTSTCELCSQALHCCICSYCSCCCCCFSLSLLSEGGKSFFSCPRHTPFMLVAVCTCSNDHAVLRAIHDGWRGYAETSSNCNIRFSSAFGLTSPGQETKKKKKKILFSSIYFFSWPENSEAEALFHQHPCCHLSMPLRKEQAIKQSIFLLASWTLNFLGQNSLNFLKRRILSHHWSPIVKNDEKMLFSQLELELFLSSVKFDVKL